MAVRLYKDRQVEVAEKAYTLLDEGQAQRPRLQNSGQLEHLSVALPRDII